MSDQDNTTDSEASLPQGEEAQLTGEMMDRAERKALKAQKKKEEQEAKAKLKDELGDSLKQGRLADIKKAKRKKLMRNGGIAFGLFLIYQIYGFLFSPYMAGPSYGICKVFLQTEVRFPQDLEYRGLEDFGDSVRIWYRRVDAFGSSRIENIRCYYRYDEAAGSSVVDRVTIDRREIDPKRVESFNRALPVVLQNLPDLTYPAPLDDRGINDLQVDPNALRKPIL